MDFEDDELFENDTENSDDNADDGEDPAEKLLKRKYYPGSLIYGE